MWFMRWMTSTIIAPHLKNPVAPEKLIKLPMDGEKKNKKGSVREKLEKFDKVFELWDQTPEDKWKTEVYK